MTGKIHTGKMKFLIVSLLIFAIAALMAGCIEKANVEATSAQDVKEELKGEIKMDGSTTVYPIALQASKVFMKDHPGVTFDLRQSSTGEGLVRFLAGETNISDATRPPKDSEYNIAKNKGMILHMTLISYDGVVLIVHPGNPVSDLTIDQIKGIYFNGSITDWSQLTNGAKKGKINIYNTDPKISGTAELFNKVITGNDETPYVSGTTKIHPTPLNIPTIMNDPNGIAYTPINWVNSSVKMLKLNGITPSRSTILDTSYPLARKMFMITNGPPQGLSKDYINFILSRDGQRIVEEEGFIPII